MTRPCHVRSSRGRLASRTTAGARRAATAAPIRSRKPLSSLFLAAPGSPSSRRKLLPWSLVVMSGRCFSLDGTGHASGPPRPRPASEPTTGRIGRLRRSGTGSWWCCVRTRESLPARRPGSCCRRPTARVARVARPRGPPGELGHYSSWCQAHRTAGRGTTNTAARPYLTAEGPETAAARTSRARKQADGGPKVPLRRTAGP